MLQATRTRLPVGAGTPVCSKQRLRRRVDRYGWQASYRRRDDAGAGRIRKATPPTEVLLVADAMTGQDAVRSAQEFHKRLGLTGSFSRNGRRRARSAGYRSRRFTGRSIKFVGIGEKVDALEPFSRSLGGQNSRHGRCFVSYRESRRDRRSRGSVELAKRSAKTNSRWTILGIS